MRAKFVIRIPATAPNSFPSDENFADRLVMLGLAKSDAAKQEYEDRRKNYLEQAEREWDHLPEVAERERDDIIFFARFPDHGRLIVTRVADGFATFRLIHGDLAELEEGAETLIEELGKKVGAINPLEVEDNRVEIYERGQDRVIITGRVITNPLREARKRHPADIVAAAVTGVASILTLVVLAFGDLEHGTVVLGTVERFSTAMMASFFISVVTFIQHWRQIARNRTIEWQPASSKRND
jgi:hypothetical protein